MSDHEMTAPEHPSGHDDHSAEHVRKHLKFYFGVFGALLILTFVTVGASYINFGTSAANIAVALFIATIKAALVAAFFMHLSSEKVTIYRFLAVTVLFAIALFALTALAYYDPIQL